MLPAYAHGRPGCLARAGRLRRNCTLIYHVLAMQSYGYCGAFQRRSLYVDPNLTPS
eukprot:COSAG01_NODE_69669_length_260_cov_2.757764_1_plen_55_part_01